MDELTMSGGVQLPREIGSMMTPEEKRDDLEGLMEAVTDKYKMFEGQLSSSDAQVRKIKDESIAMLFEILQKNGIDPSNQEQVAQFLLELKEENPDVYMIFEQAVSKILSYQEAEEMAQIPEGMEDPQSKIDMVQELPPPVPGPDMEQPINQVPQI